jgi:hypothetical protein
MEPTRVEHRKGTPLLDRLLVLPAYNKLGCKGMPFTNTVAYYKPLQITAVKSFTTLDPGLADYHSGLMF